MVFLIFPLFYLHYTILYIHITFFVKDKSSYFNPEFIAVWSRTKWFGNACSITYDSNESFIVLYLDYKYIWINIIFNNST